MKKTLSLSLIIMAFFANAQTYNAAYVHALYAKYPTTKSNFCKSCKDRDNPFYKSIADTERHMPLVTYYVYTTAHRQAQEKLNIDRKGVFSEWHPVTGQPDLGSVYTATNKAIGKPNSPQEIALGHCQAWILLAWCQDGAILSDTYDFNEGMEYQGQNVGTEIATENLCRTLTGWKKPAVTDQIKIWCGTSGGTYTYTSNKITVTVPDYYWKIIEYVDKSGNTITHCWWMPNIYTEKEDVLPKREVTIEQLIKNVGFDPQKVFK